MPHLAAKLIKQMYGRCTPSWERLVRFRPRSDPARVLVGRPVDAHLDVGLATYQGAPVEVEVYSGSSILSPGRPTGAKEEVKRLESPLAQHEVGTIRCIGLNYAAHASEAGLEIPTVPTVFLKPAEALAGPFPDKIVVPHFTVHHKSADYEAELAVIIGRDAKNVHEDQAMDFVLGYTAANDVSSRRTQFETTQWSRSKSYDKACPIGPCVVSASAIPNPSALTIQGIKNGRKMQDGLLSDLIFPIPRIISFLSQGTTLRAGTVILTGTPAGIGFFFNPPEILRDGDEFKVTLSGGIGTLVNRVEYEAQAGGPGTVAEPSN
ncbi:hypothetical protein JCM8097_000218 [Rhodosporidiobolus ruineniae]